MDTENKESLKAVMEGLIFTSGEEGLSLIQIQSVLDQHEREELQLLLEEMQQECAAQSRGIELVRYGGRWKYVAKESVYPWAKKLYAKAEARALSSAALEVLALVAYRQPITRVEIDEIRGVGSDMTLKKLQARGLVETCGHKDAIGRPLLYRVTQGFLDCFGMESLSDLPEYEADPKKQTLFDQMEES